MDQSSPPHLHIVRVEEPAPVDVPRFSPARLTSARTLRGWTKTLLAEAVGCTTAAISQFESGTAAPSPSLEKGLARALLVRPGYFEAGRPCPSLGVDAVSFRAPARTPQLRRHTALQVAKLAWELRTSLTKHVTFPVLNTPLADDSGSESFTSPEAAALALRDAWGLGWEPVPHLVRLLESQGVLVVDVPGRFELHDMDGYSYPTPDCPVIMLVPGKGGGNVYRRRFSLAHELGHLALHASCDGQDSSKEREADRFAAEFLAPRRCLDNQLPSRFDEKRLRALSEHWGVSVDSLVYRARSLSKISQTTARRWYQRLAVLRQGGHLVEPSYTDFLGERPMMFAKAMDVAGTVGVSVADVAASVCLPVDQVLEFMPGAPTQQTLALAE